MKYDEKSNFWGIEKLVGFGLLYGVRVFSLILLYLLKTQDPMTLFLFSSTMETKDAVHNFYNVSYYDAVT